jgi:hypothetical protein
VTLDLRVPVNTTATLVLPTGGAVTEDGRPAADAEGVEKVAKPDGRVIYSLGSGRYRFVVTRSD